MDKTVSIPGVDESHELSPPRRSLEEGSGSDVAAQRRRILVVLGMHRSGTSLLSNMLHLLGVDMADITDHVSPKNPGGFWERPELVAIQDDVLEAIDRPIGKPSHFLPFPAAWWRRKEVQAIKPRLISYVREQLVLSRNPWGFKDPRTCRLLPLWWEVFRELNVDPIYVHAVRSPREVSVSMSQKSSARKMSIATAELMWLSYNYDIVRYVTAKQSTLLVNYADWFLRPLEVAEELARSMGLGGELGAGDFAELVTSTVRAEYRHHDDGSADRAFCIPVAEAFYETLSAPVPQDDAFRRRLRTHASLADMLFKSVAPVVPELDAAARVFAQHVEITGEMQKLTGNFESSESRIRQLEEELERQSVILRNQQEENGRLQLAIETANHLLATNQGEYAELQKDLESSRTLQSDYLAKVANLEEELENLRKGLEDEKARAAELSGDREHWRGLVSEEKGRARKLEQELESSRKRENDETERAAKLEQELESSRSRANDESARAAEFAQELESSRKRENDENARAAELEQELESSRSRANDETARAAKLEQELEEWRKLASDEKSRVAELERELESKDDLSGRRQTRIQELERELDLKIKEIAKKAAAVETLNVELQRSASRFASSVDEITRLQETLAQQEAERAQDKELFKSLEIEKIEAHRNFEQSEIEHEKALQALRGQADEAKGTINRLTCELQVRETELAERRGSDASRGASSVGIFAWPQEENQIEVQGSITRVDGRGLSGSLLFVNRPSLTPVVEVRVGDELVLTKFCARTAVDDLSSEWPFEITWSRFPLKYAGRDAVIMASGVEVEIGRARIPGNLAEYYASPAAVAAKLLGGTIEEASRYHQWILENEGAEDIRLAQRYYDSRLGLWPVITVLVYGGDHEAQESTLRSLQSQVYREWKAICIGGSSPLEDIDPRIQVVSREKFTEAFGELEADDLLSFIAAGDTVAPTALLHLGIAAEESPDFALIYSDEDRIDPRTGFRAVPHMKGEWSPDLGLAIDYISRLALVRNRNIEPLQAVDSASIYAATLRAAITGETVRHIPFVLYHRASPPLAGADLAKCADLVLSQSGSMAQVAVSGASRVRVQWPLPETPPKVSLIIPTRDRVDLLKVCVEGILNDTDYKNLEILIADNDSEEDDTKTFLSKVSSHPRVRVISCPGPFNFSAINNAAAHVADGTILGLINNDLKIMEPDWLPQMVAHIVRPDVGIVGAKLLHGDDTVQHAGITLGIGIASHLYKGFPGDAGGDHGRLVLPQDVSAVTAACLLIRRELWDEIGGLDENFPVAYNDVDLCLKVRSMGYRILWTPDALVYHLESQSRGQETTPEKRERLENDKARLVARWGNAVASDPFYSPNLSNRHVDGRLAFPPRVVAPWRLAAT